MILNALTTFSQLRTLTFRQATPSIIFRNAAQVMPVVDKIHIRPPWEVSGKSSLTGAKMKKNHFCMPSIFVYFVIY